MMPMELATIVQEGVKVIFVLLQNHGFASIGALSGSHGSQRFGTKYTTKTGGILPVDIAANARSWGIDVLEVGSIEEFKSAYKQAEKADKTTMIYIETDIMGPNPPSNSWWDVAVAEVSELESTQKARAEYIEGKKAQRHYL
jgi:3D-(3,5/4)-trihydroxycyclohexane-1,2-dione acylhydrolase (decyclizing)